MLQPPIPLTVPIADVMITPTAVGGRVTIYTLLLHILFLHTLLWLLLLLPLLLLPLLMRMVPQVWLLLRVLWALRVL